MQFYKMPHFWCVLVDRPKLLCVESSDDSKVAVCAQESNRVFLRGSIFVLNRKFSAKKVFQNIGTTYLLHSGEVCTQHGRLQSKERPALPQRVPHGLGSLRHVSDIAGLAVPPRVRLEGVLHQAEDRPRLLRQGIGDAAAGFSPRLAQLFLGTFQARN